jgi:hypothetical protein
VFVFGLAPALARGAVVAVRESLAAGGARGGTRGKRTLCALV